MNLQEFKAWFEGFTENMKGPPSDKAWKRIQSRVSEITEKPTEVRYFYDHYWRPYYGYYGWNNGLVYCGNTTKGIGVGSSGYSTTLQDLSQNSTETLSNSSSPQFGSVSQAFTALGHADAQALM